MVIGSLSKQSDTQQCAYAVYGGNKKELDSRLLLPLPSPNSTTVIGYTDLPAGRSVGIGFRQMYSL